MAMKQAGAPRAESVPLLQMGTFIQIHTYNYFTGAFRRMTDSTTRTGGVCIVNMSPGLLVNRNQCMFSFFFEATSARLRDKLDICAC